MPPEEIPWYQRAALGICETADALGVTRQYLSRMARDGELRVVKLGRRTLVPVSEIRRLIGEEITETGDAS